MSEAKDAEPNFLFNTFILLNILSTMNLQNLISEPEPPPPDPSLVPPGPASHPAWPGPGMMLPPPHPPKRVYFSYFERRHQENEAFDDEEENVVDEAKRLKHEADQETNMNNRCRKYLQVIVNKFTAN